MDRHDSPAPRLASRRLAPPAVVSAALCCQLLTACATAPRRLPALVPEQEQALQPGDILRIDVWRQSEYSGEFILGTGGSLVHPLYQEVKLEGASVSEARARINRFLGGYLQGARLVVEPLYRVSVAGEVREPGMYHVSRGTTVAQAIGMAGGPTNQAQLDQLLLVREGEQYPLRLGEGITTFGEVPLVSGDQILVERASTFSVWRDVVAPVGTLASLVLAVVRINEKTGS